MKTALLEIRGDFLLFAFYVSPLKLLNCQRNTVLTGYSLNARQYYRTTAQTHSNNAYSGSAFPATLAFQIRELERETNDDLKLDAIVTVIDAENFTGYEDTSPTAKMQASYTDVILIVRWCYLLSNDGSPIDHFIE